MKVNHRANRLHQKTGTTHRHPNCWFVHLCQRKCSGGATVSIAETLGAAAPATQFSVVGATGFIFFWPRCRAEIHSHATDNPN